MRYSTRTIFLVTGLLLGAALAGAQQKKAPNTRAVPKRTAVPATPTTAPAPIDDVLSNDSVIAMVKAKQDPAGIAEKIKTSKTRFNLDADHLVQLKENNVPSAVVRAMLAKGSAPTSDGPVDSPTGASPAKDAAIAERPPAPSAPPAPPPIPTNLETAIARQGGASQPLPDRPQKVMFVKSDATDPKTAIANTVIMQVGLPLLTMGMSTQMSMWNPYMGETFTKAANLGKGVVLGHGVDTQGYEFDLLPGLSAPVTLKEGPVEFLVPLNRYVASAGTDLSDLQPVLLSLESREKDQARVLSSRHVLLKQNKKGRFDLKPVIERQESDVQQTIVPVNIRHADGDIYSITTPEPLKRGEYALVFRKKSQTGQYTANVPLKLLTPQGSIVSLQPQASGEPGAKAKGPFGRMRVPGASNAPSSGEGEQQMTGFIAWDFRVLP